MKYINFKELLLTSGILCACLSVVKSACAADEESSLCGGKEIEICYGGGSGITKDDVICIHENECNMTFRQDKCSECDLEPSKYTNGSQYMDCAGDCYKPDDTASMLKVDACGVCDGNNETCSPAVTGLDLGLIPTSNTVAFNISGTSFLTTDLQIVFISHKTGKSSIDKKVEGLFDIVNVYSGTQMEIRTGTIGVGTYEIGARTGNDGSEYKNHDGPMLTVYDENDFGVTSISPYEQDIDGTTEVSVTLEMSPNSGEDIKQLYDIRNQFTCFVRETSDTSIVDVDTESAIKGTYDEGGETVECRLSVPESPAIKWLCVSFNGRHIVGCKNITYFETAPAVKEELLRFDATASSLYVVFDKRIDRNSDLPCSSYFENVTSLGSTAFCRLSGDKLRLSVTLGDGASLLIDDNIVLKAGLMTEGDHVRATDAITLTVAGAAPGDGGDDSEIGGGTLSIVIVPLTAWKTIFTTFSYSTATFGIQILKSPGSRGAQEVTWTLDGNVIDGAANQLELVLAVPEVEGRYTVQVTATDFMGGQASITHIFQKLNVNLPDITLIPLGGRILSDGRFEIHPNTEFVINTKITLNMVGDSGGVEDYVWIWRKNKEELINAALFYKSPSEDITIDMCDQTVNYSLAVALKGSLADKLEYHITCIVKCRDPVARISGSKQINIDITYGSVDLYGASSYDLDGGVLKYFWSCQTIGDWDCLDAIVNPNQDAANESAVSLLSTRMKAGKSYQLKLTVLVEKSGENYTGSDTMNFNAKSGDMPVVRMVTIRNKFRKDTPIMVKAHISGEIKSVKWEFVNGLADYDWLDAENTTIGSTTTIGQFSWFTINRGILSSGRKYQLEIEVTAPSDQTATELHNVYVYRILSGCQVEARNMVEMQESYITLRKCIHDSDVAWITIHCSVDGIELHLTPSTTFITPIFPNDVTTAILQCTVTDSLGYQMSIESNMVTVTKATPQQRDQTLNGFLESGNYVEALDILADMTLTDDIKYNTEAVGVLESILINDPSPEDLRRALLGYSRLEVEHVKEKHELDVLMGVLKSITAKLCVFSEDQAVDHLTDDDIVAILDTTAKLVKTKLEYRLDYRTISNRLACTRMKRMRNEDFKTFEVNEDARHIYAVNTLDDISDFGLAIEFPEEIRAKYRDTWKCEDSMICHGIGLKVEEYLTEPPDMAFKRADKECSQYLIVDLFNQVSGKRISVNNLEDVINMVFNGETCPRAECWYYDSLLERFSQDEVFTYLKENGSIVQCQSKHLTAFTIRSGPEKYEGINIPYIISVTVGSTLLVLSCIVLIKAFCATKRRANTVDDLKEHLPAPEVTPDSPPPVYHFRASNEEMKQHYR